MSAEGRWYDIRHPRETLLAVPIEQLRDMVNDGKLPLVAKVRPVVPWMSVTHMLKTTGATAGFLVEVRTDDAMVGPVSFDQLQRGFAAGMIPADAEARWVGEWNPLASALAPANWYPPRSH